MKSLDIFVCTPTLSIDISKCRTDARFHPRRLDRRLDHGNVVRLPLVPAIVLHSRELRPFIKSPAHPGITGYIAIYLKAGGETL
jgi:hypothetical protein